MAAAVVLRSFCRTIKLTNYSVRSATRWQQNIHRPLSTSASLLDRKYTKKHEWVEISSDKNGKVGITHYAQDALGDIVYVQLPQVGTEYAQGDECGALESVKAASELYSPVSGKILETNTALEDQPALINESCYTDGWLFIMEFSKAAELDDLMDETSYDKFVKDMETDT